MLVPIDNLRQSAVSVGQLHRFLKASFKQKGIKNDRVTERDMSEQMIKIQTYRHW